MAPIRKLFLTVCNLFQNLITGFASDRRSGFIWMEHVSTNTKQQLYGLTLFTQTPRHPNWPSVSVCGFMCVRMSMHVGRVAFFTVEARLPSCPQQPCDCECFKMASEQGKHRHFVDTVTLKIKNPHKNNVRSLESQKRTTHSHTH